MQFFFFCKKASEKKAIDGRKEANKEKEKDEQYAGVGDWRGAKGEGEDWNHS